MDSLTEFECGWLSAAIDGEGTIGMWKRQCILKHLRGNPLRSYINVGLYEYGFTVEIATTDSDFVRYSSKICGEGRQVTTRKEDKRGNRKMQYRWSMTYEQIQVILPQLSLMTKRAQAEYAVLFTGLFNANSRRPVDMEEAIFLEEAYKEMALLNKRGVPDTEAEKIKGGALGKGGGAQ